MSQLEALGPLFVRPYEPDRFWILVLVFSAPTIAVALFALVRGRLPTVLSLPVLFLLPVFGYALGNLQILEESKRVTFCGSCHETMSPLVETLRADDSTLAGFHYQNGAVSHESACYQCHSGYGIWGGMSAKLAGVRHMLHTVTGAYDYPLSLDAPLDIDACLECHAEATPFRAVEDHHDPDTQRMLVEREMGCTGDCHPSAHPAAALNGAEAWAETR